MIKKTLVNRISSNENYNKVLWFVPNFYSNIRVFIIKYSRNGNQWKSIWSFWLIAESSEQNKKWRHIREWKLFTRQSSVWDKKFAIKSEVASQGPRAALLLQVVADEAVRQQLAQRCDENSSSDRLGHIDGNVDGNELGDCLAAHTTGRDEAVFLESYHSDGLEGFESLADGLANGGSFGTHGWAISAALHVAPWARIFSVTFFAEENFTTHLWKFHLLKYVKRRQQRTWSKDL